MSSPEIRVTFTPGGATVMVPAGELLLNAAVAAGVPLAAPCGGHGRCGKCRVQIQQGHCLPPDRHERNILSADELKTGWRLACMARVRSDIVVSVAPEQRLVIAKPLEDELLEGVTPEPAVRQVTVSLPEPSLQDQRADFVRLRDGLAPAVSLDNAALTALRDLPGELREGQFTVSATLLDDRLVGVATLDEAQHPLGVAVDIGTTTVVAYLVDLLTGEHLGSGTAHNPQAQHGADVISRTDYAANQPGGLSRLQSEAVGVVNQVVSQALAAAGGHADQVIEMTVVGNTCMHHLFLGLDPWHIAQAPYIPVASDAITVTPGSLGLKMNAQGRVVCLPVIAGYVGADTVGVITATRMMDSDRPVLAVDIGTNGEVALWSGERLVCASCAAGPAFEGAQIEHGMRAAPGAISAVDLHDGDLQITTIDDQRPLGLCGSGLFDAMAVCLEAGLVDAMGRMVAPDREQDLAPALAARLQGEGNTRRILLASDGDAEAHAGVYFTQKDVRELQLAKGAVRAAVELLLRECGLKVEDLSAVLLAGAFGNYLRPQSALRMGLLPPMSPTLIRGVGNAAGAGAMLALLSLPWRRRAEEIARRAEHLELAQRPDFQQMFMETMLFM
ncbi:ASKHA domain-containing protein [bacterium]|nr:ASKHA domain-containing protein [bacterium]